MMIARLAIGVVCAILVQAATSKPGLLRSEVREIIRPKCGSCHTSSLPTAKPKALTIFDVKRDDWPTTISERQFKAFKGRLNDMSDSLKHEIDVFVKGEIALRRAAGS